MSTPDTARHITECVELNREIPNGARFCPWCALPLTNQGPPAPDPGFGVAVRNYGFGVPAIHPNEPLTSPPPPGLQVVWDESGLEPAAVPDTRGFGVFRPRYPGAVEHYEIVVPVFATPAEALAVLNSAAASIHPRSTDSSFFVAQVDEGYGILVRIPLDLTAPGHYALGEPVVSPERPHLQVIRDEIEVTAGVAGTHGGYE